MRIGMAKDVSKMLGISVQRVYELTRANEIPAIRLGARQLRYDLDVIEQWARLGGTSNWVLGKTGANQAAAAK